MGEVINLNTDTLLDIPADKVIEGAVEADLDMIVVIGWGKDGSLYFGSSSGDAPEIMWLLQTAQKLLMDMQD